MAPLTGNASNANPSSTRKALGELSPNVKHSSSTTSSAAGKALSGSPLKRSFTASIEGGRGFTYLKKRKLSAEEAIGHHIDDVSEKQDHTSRDAEGSSIRSQGAPTEQFAIPTIQPLSPTEPNTPTPSSSAGEGEGNDSSAERKSFSSLINYEPSSQNATSGNRNSSGGSSSSSSKHPKSNNLIFSGPSYAEILRLRLRMAMFKVRTNQVDVPFADLVVEDEDDAASARRPLSLQSPPSFSAERSRTGRATAAEVEEAIAALRREAQEAAAAVRLPTVAKRPLPAPVLRPTAYSSRTIADWAPPPRPSSSVAEDMTSELRPANPAAAAPTASTTRSGLRGATCPAKEEEEEEGKEERELTNDSSGSCSGGGGGSSGLVQGRVVEGS